MDKHAALLDLDGFQSVLQHSSHLFLETERRVKVKVKGITGQNFESTAKANKQNKTKN